MVNSVLAGRLCNFLMELGLAQVLVILDSIFMSLQNCVVSIRPGPVLILYEDRLPRTVVAAKIKMF